MIQRVVCGNVTITTTGPDGTEAFVSLPGKIEATMEFVGDLICPGHSAGGGSDAHSKRNLKHVVDFTAALVDGRGRFGDPFEGGDYIEVVDFRATINLQSSAIYGPIALSKRDTKSLLMSLRTFAKIWTTK